MGFLGGKWQKKIQVPQTEADPPFDFAQGRLFGDDNRKGKRDFRLGGSSSWEVEGGEGGDDLLGFEGDGDDLTDEAKDIAFVVCTVGVVGDAGAGVGGDAVLIDDPFEGGAVAEAVVQGRRGCPPAAVI